jgi:hypothetical protein
MYLCTSATRRCASETKSESASTLRKRVSAAFTVGKMDMTIYTPIFKPRFLAKIGVDAVTASIA